MASLGPSSSALELAAVVRAQVRQSAAVAKVDRLARSAGPHVRDGLTGAATPAFLLALLSQELRRAGYQPGDALMLALRNDVDLHMAADLLACGCPERTALLILI